VTLVRHEEVDERDRVTLHCSAFARAQQDRLMTRHDRTQHTWFMGFLEQILGQAEPRAEAAQ
jgi:hypothetical protein